MAWLFNGVAWRVRGANGARADKAAGDQINQIDIDIDVSGRMSKSVC